MMMTFLTQRVSFFLSFFLSFSRRGVARIRFY